MKLKLSLIISILMILISCSGENAANQAVEINESTSVEMDKSTTLSPPTGNLDIASGKDILQLFKDLCHDEENPISILLVTHDPDLASQADRMLLLRNGVVAASDIRSAWGLDDKKEGEEE